MKTMNLELNFDPGSVVFFSENDLRELGVTETHFRAGWYLIREHGAIQGPYSTRQAAHIAAQNVYGY